MPDPKTWVDTLPREFIAGVQQTNRVRDVRTAVGPASYTQGTGIAVDLSAVFSTLDSVRVSRVYVTATKAHSPYKVEVHEAGSDLFSSRKFRLLFYQQNDPDAASGNVQGLAGGVSADAGSPPTLTAAATASGTQADPDAAVGGPAVVLTAHTHTVNLDKIPQHQHAVTKAVAAFPEVGGTTDLSTITVEYEAKGVLA